jgi:hypothetical protein
MGEFGAHDQTVYVSFGDDFYCLWPTSGRGDCFVHPFTMLPNSLERIYIPQHPTNLTRHEPRLSVSLMDMDRVAVEVEDSAGRISWNGEWVNSGRCVNFVPH